MTHDPLCPIEPNPLAHECRTCDLISMVREDERSKLLPAHWSQDWNLGYRQGVADTEKKFRDER